MRSGGQKDDDFLLRTASQICSSVEAVAKKMSQSYS